MGFRIDRQADVFLLYCAEQRVDLREGFDFVAPELDAIGHVVVGGEDFDYVAADAESSAAEIAVGALVEDFDQLAGDVFALDLLALFQKKHHAVIGFWRAQAVDAAYRGYDQAIAAFEERARGREAELVQFVIDGGFFLNVQVGRGNVGFGLVEVIVRDEVLDGVVREEIFEFVIELGGQGFVVGHDERGAVQLLDHFSGCVSFAGAGYAQKDLMLFAIEQTSG